MAGQVPEGWYADPQGGLPGDERWWNGHQWTAHTRQVPPPAAASGTGAPGAPPPPADTAPGRDVIDQLKALPKALPDGTRLPEPAERIGAYVVDVVVVAVVGHVLAALVGVAVQLVGIVLPAVPVPFPVLGGLDAVVVLLCWLGYQLVSRGSGATIGKRLFHLRVRPLDPLAPLTSGQVLRRAVVGSGGVLCTLFPGSPLLGLLLIGYDVYRATRDEHGRPWHDQLAGTVVVKATG